jgi:uncharacterized membrane protein
MKYFVLFCASTFPVFSYAAVSNAKELISAVMFLVSIVIPIVAMLSLGLFFWGLARFVYHADNADSREEGRRLMFWGIIALFVMFSIWGIVSLISSDLGVGFSDPFIGYTL